MEYHVPVLYKEVLSYIPVKKEGIIADFTTGGGGHSEGILKLIKENNSNMKMICFDRDIDAINQCKKRLADYENYKLIHANFHDMKTVFEQENIQGIDVGLMDLGVSSFQLDNKDRGFSYHNDAELDMRMDQSQSFSAKDIVNKYTQDDLERVIKDYGEERWAKRIAEFIIKNRPINTTHQLVDAIKQAIPSKVRRDGKHPAKKTFQALRIETNSELSMLGAALEDAVEALNKDGILMVITFHSLEDRIVKQKFKELATDCICPPEMPICVCNHKATIKQVTRKPIISKEEELEENRRARTAKLRVIKKL